MTATKLLIRAASRLAVLISIAVIGTFFLRMPLIDNALALAQLENSDTVFIVSQIALEAERGARVVFSGLCGVFALATAYDIYEIIKTQKEQTN